MPSRTDEIRRRMFRDPIADEFRLGETAVRRVEEIPAGAEVGVTVAGAAAAGSVPKPSPLPGARPAAGRVLKFPKAAGSTLPGLALVLGTIAVEILRNRWQKILAREEKELEEMEKELDILREKSREKREKEAPAVPAPVEIPHEFPEEIPLPPEIPIEAEPGPLEIPAPEPIPEIEIPAPLPRSPAPEQEPAPQPGTVPSSPPGRLPRRQPKPAPRRALPPFFPTFPGSSPKRRPKPQRRRRREPRPDLATSERRLTGARRGVIEFADISAQPMAQAAPQSQRRCKPCPEERDDPRTQCFKKLVFESELPSQDESFDWAEIDCFTGREL